MYANFKKKKSGCQERQDEVYTVVNELTVLAM